MGARCSRRDGRLLDASCNSVPPYTLKIGAKLGLVDARSNPLTPVHFDAVAWAGPGAKNVKIDRQVGTHRARRPLAARAQVRLPLGRP